MFPDAKLFRDIAHCRSISRGAALNRISQSAASQQLQEMERRLSVQLLDRSVRPVGLTEAGKLYSELCRDIIRREEEFRAGLEALKTEVEGQVRVASIYSVGLYEMTRLRETLCARFPKVQLEVEYQHPDRIYHSVLTDHADLGLVSYPEAVREVSVIDWREEPMVVVLPAGHPLGSRAEIDPALLEDQPFIAFDSDLGIRRHIDRFLRERGVEIRVVMEFDNIQTVKEAVALGSGISILPHCAVEAEIAQGRLVGVALTESLSRPVGIIHRRRKKLNRAARELIGLLVPPASFAKLSLM
ncbi:MAG: LysR family transcriptional regulator [Acidobacteriota bacterium]|nr:LysR family transcriptional regulator [Acidobacteriota bacterium]